MSRRNLTSAKKAAFWKSWYLRFGWTCYYCKVEISRYHPVDYWKRATIDHLVPLSRGGTNRQENLVGSCYRCNREKADIRTW